MTWQALFMRPHLVIGNLRCEVDVTCVHEDVLCFLDGALQEGH
jgi:hypothetical protein